MAPLTYMHRSVKPDAPELPWPADARHAARRARGCIAPGASQLVCRTKTASVLCVKPSGSSNLKGAIAMGTNAVARQGGLGRQSWEAVRACRGGRSGCAGRLKLACVRAAHEQEKGWTRLCTRQTPSAVQYAEMAVRRRRRQRPAPRSCGALWIRRGRRGTESRCAISGFSRIRQGLLLRLRFRRSPGDRLSRSNPPNGAG